MANRLSTFIGSYIHKDQVGFILGRQGPDQIRRAVDMIFFLQSKWDGGPHQEGFLLSVDLQKAFNMVNWSYLSILNRWGFLQIIQALYSNPRAQVKLKSYYSNPFPI